MDFQVIRATIQNADDMGFVHSYSWKKAYCGIIPDEIIDSFTVKKRAEVFRDVLYKSTEEYYFFKSDNMPAGIASIYKSHEKDASSDEGEIYAIYFHPNFWKTAITQKALEFCINRLKEQGFKQINIWVLKDNKRAQKFYEKNGFCFDGHEQEIIIGKSLVEIRYSKKI